MTQNARVKSAEFIKSSVSFLQCPEEALPEFAVIGRSNAGKSSLINLITGRKSLAMISKTPGKTQTINHFRIISPDQPWHLVDLPGYGFARAPQHVQDQWIAFTKEYFAKRQSLLTVLLLVDSTVKPQQIDIECADWLGTREVPFTIVFTKMDKRRKLKPGQRVDHHTNVDAFKQALVEDGWDADALPPMLLTSSKARTGKSAILNHLAELRDLWRKQGGKKEILRTKPLGSAAAAAAAAR